jgi:glycosyltransferase involved in cell wall biosynthesis
MKIGILGSRGIPNQYGGFEQFAEKLALGLTRLGVSVWVYCSDSHPLKTSTWNGINRILCFDPEDKIGTAGQFIYDLKCINDSRNRNFDIIYQLGYTSNSVWYRHLPDGPAIVTNMDGIEWKRSKYSPLVKRFLRYAEKLAVHGSDVLVADSEAIGKHLMEFYQASSVFLPYGADVFTDADEKKLRNEGLQAHEYFLLIARLQPDNHIEEIIEGVIQSESPFPLLVIGNHQNRFGKYLKKKYENDRIWFLGGIFNPERLNNLRHFATLYFHGHSAGGTNPSLLEAMSAGALICAHDNPFNREVLDKEAFYFKTPGDITSLLNNSRNSFEAREEFREMNLSKIRDKYNWEKIIDDYYNLFSDLI